VLRIFLSDSEINKNSKRYNRDKMIEIKYQYIELITSVIKQLMKDKKKLLMEWNLIIKMKEI